MEVALAPPIILIQLLRLEWQIPEVVEAVSQVRKKSESALRNMTVAEIIGV